MLRRNRRTLAIGVVSLLAAALLAPHAGAALGAQPLSLSVKARVVYKRDAHYVVTLVPVADVSNLEVSVYAKPKGDPEYLVETTTVDPVTGVLEGDVKNLKTKTTVRATWDGDAGAGYPNGDEAKDSVDVRVDLHGKMLKFERIEGKNHIYGAGKNVWFKSWVEPKNAGETLTFRFQRFVNHNWTLLGHGKIPIEHGSVTVYMLASFFTPGTRYRIYSKHPGDDDLHLIGNQTGYFYFKVEGS